MGLMKWFLIPFSLLLLVFLPGDLQTGERTAPEKKPNILFILTDDQDPKSIRNMPQLQSLLVDRGVSFTHSYVTTPQCCPSRTTMLRGQYAHNHGIRNNKLPEGGAIKLRKDGLDESTIATWMKDAGYDTAYIGKYLNEYDALYVPPGWDRWYGFMGSYSNHGTNRYSINENGARRAYNLRRLHDTDYMAGRATGFIETRGDSDKPWFMVVAPNAPHKPSYAARRHENLFRKAELPTSPSFNEKDVSDKPAYVKSQPRYSPIEVEEIEEEWRQRLRALRSVDEMIEGLVATLEDSGQLEETYIVYTTDNGYMLGRHRLETKGVPYEESIRAPLIVRGPGIPEGATREQLVASTDWAPTIASWGGARLPGFADGRPLQPLLSEDPPKDWRERLLVEFWHARPFSGLLTESGVRYVEYDTGEKELYDLRIDPYQLANRIEQTPQSKLDSLADVLERLESCEAEGCRIAEE